MQIIPIYKNPTNSLSKKFSNRWLAGAWHPHNDNASPLFHDQTVTSSSKFLEYPISIDTISVNLIIVFDIFLTISGYSVKKQIALT